MWKAVSFTRNKVFNNFKHEQRCNIYFYSTLKEMRTPFGKKRTRQINCKMFNIDSSYVYVKRKCLKHI